MNEQNAKNILFASGADGIGRTRRGLWTNSFETNILLPYLTASQLVSAVVYTDSQCNFHICYCQLSGAANG